MVNIRVKEVQLFPNVLVLEIFSQPGIGKKYGHLTGKMMTSYIKLNVGDCRKVAYELLLKSEEIVE